MLNKRLYLLTLFLQFIASPLTCSQSRAVQEQEQKALTYNQIVQQAATRALHLPIHPTNQAICYFNSSSSSSGLSSNTIFGKNTVPHACSDSLSTNPEPTPIEEHVNAIVGERAPNKQKEIARVLYQATELPKELIKLIINYEARIFSQHADAIIGLVLLSNNHLASASKDQTIRIWDIEKDRCLNVLKHSIAITTITALPKNKIAAGEGDHSIKIWNTDTGICEKRLIKHTHTIVGLVALPNDQLASAADYVTQVPGLIYGIWDISKGLICIWDLTTASVIRTINLDNPISDLWINHDNTLVAATTKVSKIEGRSGERFEKGIYILDPVTGKTLDSKFNYHGNSVKISGFTQLMTDRMATAGDDENIYIYGFPDQSSWRDTSYKKYTPFWTPGIKSWPIKLVCLPNAKIASGGWSDSKVRVINPETTKCEGEYPVDTQTTALAALPNNQLATGSPDGRVTILSLYQ